MLLTQLIVCHIKWLFCQLQCPGWARVQVVLKEFSPKFHTQPIHGPFVPDPDAKGSLQHVILTQKAVSLRCGGWWSSIKQESLWKGGSWGGWWVYEPGRCPFSILMHKPNLSLTLPKWLCCLNISMWHVKAPFVSSEGTLKAAFAVGMRYKRAVTKLRCLTT